ncbi:hypothetical protein ACHAXS_004538 [Conticribra weissflogii]
MQQKNSPILMQAAKHAKDGCIMCSELPENGNVGMSYKDTTKIADYIGKFTRNGKEKERKPRTVAHLMEPGLEYLSSMWDTWAVRFCTAPLATSHGEHEFEHAFKDANPEVILIRGHVTQVKEE